MEGNLSLKSKSILFIANGRLCSHIYFFCVSLNHLYLRDGLDKNKEQKEGEHPHVSVLNPFLFLSGFVLTVVLKRSERDWNIFACKY